MFGTLRTISCLLASSAIASALSIPKTDYVVHESRRATHHGVWKRSNIADPNAIIPLRIGLRQPDMDRGYERLMEVSHPSSDMYGKHLSAEEVHDMFAPAAETTAAVRDWLLASGIKATSILEYENKGWIAVDLPVSEAERLFRTQYHEYGHGSTYRIGCDKYSVPAHLSEHIDYITPGLTLSAPLKRRYVTKRSASLQPKPRSTQSRSKRAVPKLPPPKNATCAEAFTVECYRKLYKIPASNTALPGNSVGLFETRDTFSQEDLDAYYDYFTPEIPNGTHPKPAFINGATAPVSASSKLNTGESDVDIAIIQPLVWPQTVTLYQVDDSYYATNGSFPAFNSFLDALDGSYCNRTAFGITGDDPIADPHYPDNHPGGYQGEKMCGVYKPERVISISYGGFEVGNPSVRYARRQCSEFMKLALQGHTFFVSSGDYGVGGIGTFQDPSQGCLTAGLIETAISGQSSNDNTTVFYSGWPTDCPFVTSVGATMLYSDQKDTDPESVMEIIIDTEDGAKASFSSTGGFSNFFPAPKWQKKHINKYFEKYDPGYPSYIANENATNIGEGGGLFNRAGRGFPDVSANGFNFALYVNSTIQRLEGTSLAAPLWAAITTLINQERQAIGKGPVGFINPVLYEHPEVLTDIKNGSNPNCGTDGFKAVKGWDPVTGLGTPRYDKLLELFKSLP
ncbi:subtilisin-like protein [Thozetella sp. PMI_491]|nr:subtilisin-like protein [Thozetella sp. PMI_491]